MRKSVRFVVTLPASIAARVTDPARGPAEKGAILAELLSPGGGRWYAGHVYRRGFAPLGVLATMPEQAAQFLILANDNARYRRTILQALAAWDAMMFVSAAPADVHTPPAAYEGVPLDDFWAAQESRAALEAEFPPDARVCLARSADGERAAV